jgi:hypothetical protein
MISISLLPAKCLAGRNGSTNDGDRETVNRFQVVVEQMVGHRFTEPPVNKSQFGNTGGLLIQPNIFLSR